MLADQLGPGVYEFRASVRKPRVERGRHVLAYTQFVFHSCTAVCQDRLNSSRAWPSTASSDSRIRLERVSALACDTDGGQTVNKGTRAQKERTHVENVESLHRIEAVVGVVRIE